MLQNSSEVQEHGKFQVMLCSVPLDLKKSTNRLLPNLYENVIGFKSFHFVRLKIVANNLSSSQSTPCRGKLI